MQRILIAGGGVGAYSCSYLLAKAGFYVSVFERLPWEEIGGNQKEPVSLSAVADCAFSLPQSWKEAVHASDPAFFLCSPSGLGKIRLDSSSAENKKDLLFLPQHDFLSCLLQQCQKEGVSFYFDTECLSPLVEQSRVVGLRLRKEGKNYYTKGSLLIDCCGYRSPIKENLPRFLGVGRSPAENLLPTGCMVQSSCGQKNQNGIYAKPSSLFVANGYAAIGDVVGMTDPRTGSGINNALTAGAILARVILHAGEQPLTKAALWPYEAQVLQSLFSGTAGYITLFRFLSALSETDLNLLLDGTCQDFPSVLTCLAPNPFLHAGLHRFLGPTSSAIHATAPFRETVSALHKKWPALQIIGKEQKEKSKELPKEFLKLCLAEKLCPAEYSVSGISLWQMFYE